MDAWRKIWLTALVLGTIAAGCVEDGGRGSSGFDISENAAINRVLQTQECLSGERLTLCPADRMPAPTAATPTVPAGSTATPTPQPTPRIDTGLTAGEAIVCTRADPDSPCVVTLGFRASSFPGGTTFRVAGRLLTPSAPWTLAARPSVDAGVGPPSFEAEASFQLAADASAARAQFAVLVFSATPGDVPATFPALAQSGADVAFVTPEIVLDVVTEGPPPTPTGGMPTPSQPAAMPSPTQSAVGPTRSQPAASPTPTPTPTPSPSGDGPALTHLGLARADGRPMEATGTDEQGRPVYFNLFGQGMTLIVEARPGPHHQPPGREAYDIGRLPDLQVIVSQPLGDGSAAVCDVEAPMMGGVPATEPLVFSDTPAVVAAVNDFGCRVNDGTGQTLARSAPIDACTTASVLGFGFVNPESTIQFCAPIARAWAFASGDTVVAARVRDVSGALSAVAEIVVRVEGPQPTPPCEGEQRDLTIARPSSTMHSSYSGPMDVSADPWDEGPLRLCLGPEGPDGRRTLELPHDIRFGFRVVDGSILCVQLAASGSRGEIDCAGGSAHDVVVTQDSRGEDSSGAVVVETGIGADAGPGAATLDTRVSLVLRQAGTPLSQCQDDIFGSGFPTALTTATATARVTNPIQGGTVTISASGTNFDCARLTESDGPGAFVLPFPAPDTDVGDTANVLVLAD